MLTSRARLRRLLLARQGLLGERALGGARGAVTWITAQGFLPLDLEAHTLAPSHDLALFSRLSNYQLGDLDVALYDGAQLFEHCLHVPGALPAADYALVYDPDRAEAAARPGSPGARILALLQAEGPMSLRELQMELREYCDGDRRALTRTVHDLCASGAIVIRRREAGQEVYDLARRIWKSTPAPLPSRERLRALARRTLRILAPVTRTVWTQVLNGIGSRAKMGLTAMKHEKAQLINSLLDAGEAVAIDLEDGANSYFIPADWLPDLVNAGHGGPTGANGGVRVSFLPSLDPIVWDRQRVRDLFGFDWRQPLVSSPAEMRRGMDQQLAILYGDTLVGRLAPQISWARRRLLVSSIEIEDPTLADEGRFRAAFAQALHELAALHETRDIQVTGPVPPRLIP
ncbi:MAG: DNA glycosylase AlkZ-like family protein [Anaerolineae bacterium]